ncbi:hypothetical protein ACN27G_04850 [Plantactinospora sp. WMMB334]|uniref:hypothetical protein n=1 Tax=Plantactinospora sp. WMMB334 TaxID=3404119 RepID=UPI003B92BE09
MRVRPSLAATAVVVTAVLLPTAPVGAAVSLRGAAADAGAGPVAGCVPTDPAGRPVELVTADNGRTVCLLRRQRLHVTLAVDPERHPDPANWWMPIRASGTALTPVPVPAPPAPGETVANFVATGGGEGVVTSYWSICPAQGPPCGAPVRLWQATVQVSQRW